MLDRSITETRDDAIADSHRLRADIWRFVSCCFWDQKSFPSPLSGLSSLDNAVPAHLLTCSLCAYCDLFVASRMVYFRSSSFNDLKVSCHVLRHAVIESYSVSVSIPFSIAHVVFIDMFSGILTSKAKSIIILEIGTWFKNTKTTPEVYARSWTWWIWKFRHPLQMLLRSKNTNNVGKM